MNRGRLWINIVNWGGPKREPCTTERKGMRERGKECKSERERERLTDWAVLLMDRGRERGRQGGRGTAREGREWVQGGEREERGRKVEREVEKKRDKIKRFSSGEEKWQSGRTLCWSCAGLWACGGRSRTPAWWSPLHSAPPLPPSPGHGKTSAGADGKEPANRDRLCCWML